MKYFLVLWLSLTASLLLAQTNVNELMSKIQHARPSEQVNFLLQLAETKRLNDPNTAIALSEKAIGIAKDIPQVQYLGNALHKLAEIYYEQRQWEASEKSLNEELRYCMGVLDNQRKYEVYYRLANLAKNTNKAGVEENLVKALGFAGLAQNYQQMMDINYALYVEYNLKGKALESQKCLATYTAIKDSLDNKKAVSHFDSLQFAEGRPGGVDYAGGEYSVELDKGLSLRTPFLTTIGFMIMGLLWALSVIWIQQKQKKADARWETKIELTEKENLRLEEAKRSDYNFIRKLQDAMLPDDKLFHSMLPDSFVYFKQRDTIGGDYYWVKEVNNKVIFAAFDCIGRGIKGAAMTLITEFWLNKIIYEEGRSEPNNILSSLHYKVLSELQIKNPRLSFGIDIAICSYDKEKRVLKFAGAKNSLFLVQNNELIEYKANLHSIGYQSANSSGVEFRQDTINLDSDTMVYLFSDGYLQQSGSENQKKFNIKNFKELLSEMSSLPMSSQLKIIGDTMQNWMGSEKQTDDMVVLGVRL
jgi:serine phosphatase RsbU (regulator of sigma subunit)